jgi:hypothetical protein
MPSLKNYKGQWCFIKPMICQEGFCSECNVYLKISRVFTSSLEEKVNGVAGVIDKILINERRHNDVSLSDPV